VLCLVINCFPRTEFENEVLYGCGIAAFLGVICFEIGAGLALLEAINDGCFHGSAMWRLLEGHDTDAKKKVDEKVHNFFHHDLQLAHSKIKQSDVEAGSISNEKMISKPAPKRRGAVDLGAEEGKSSEYFTFRWWPTWQSFKSHHIHEVSFLACLIQFIGATIFIMSGTVSLPGITNHLSQAELNGVY
jgi:hypothetical protein